MRGMCKKILLNNKGSALAMVIIIITILSTLGMAVMTLGVVNLRISIADQKAKLSFYMAESGLEQAYGIILNEIKEAVIAGNEAVKEAIDQFIEDEIIKLAQEGDSEYVTVNENGNYIVNEDKIKQNLENGYWNSHFKDAYKEYFRNSKSSFISKLEDPNEYINPDFATGGANNKPVVSVEDKAHLDFFPGGADETTLSLCSVYGISGDAIPQRVKMQITIKTPEQIPENYYVNVVKTTLKDNPTWNKTLASFGEIVINDSKETTDGRLVVLGTMYAEDGISLNSVYPQADVSNPVRISGNVITRANVEITPDSKGCQLMINGNVFAKNVLISENTDKNRIEVNGDLYISDDLELNGTRAEVEIDGSFYGFSDGSTKAGHDQSSGIVINALDINEDDGSSLKITGTDEVFINGVSYIDTVAPLYPTGESLSIKGNYRAYSYYLPDSSGYSYSYYPPLTLVSQKKIEGTNDWKEMRIVDNARYFKMICDLPVNHTWLNKGGVNNIILPDITKVYSLGSYINKGEVIERGNVRYTMANAQDRAIIYEDIYNKSLLNDFSEYISINDDINNVAVRDTNSEFVFFSKDKSVYLLGSGFYEEPSISKEIKEVNAPIRGIIVTEKDVYIRGAINFSGLIVAKGNIYIDDSHSKIIKFDKEYVREVVGNMASDDNPFLENESWERQTYEKNYIGVIESASINPYKKYISIDSWQKETN